METQGIGRVRPLKVIMGATSTHWRDEAKLIQLVKELPASSGQLHDFITVDFTFPDEVKKKASAYVAKTPVHILINNTGGPPAGPAMDANADEFLKAFNSHLINNQHLVQAVCQTEEAQWGRVINIFASVKVLKKIGVIQYDTRRRSQLGKDPLG